NTQMSPLVIWSRSIISRASCSLANEGEFRYSYGRPSLAAKALPCSLISCDSRCAKFAKSLNSTRWLERKISMPWQWLMERRVPRNNMRSNPVIVPAMRSWCRVKKRSMILFHLMLCAKDIMREEIMGRHHLFWLRPERLRRGLRASLVLSFLKEFQHGDHGVYTE